MKQRKDVLLSEKAFSKKKYFDEVLNFFLNYKDIDNKKIKEKYKDLININTHTLELSNWILSLSN